MEERDQNFVGDLDQGPPTAGAQANSPGTGAEQKRLVLSKNGSAVRVFDLSWPEDVAELCDVLNWREKRRLEEPPYLHPKWSLSDEAPMEFCEECVEEAADAERSGIIRTADIPCPLCGGTAVLDVRLLDGQDPDQAPDALVGLYCNPCGYECVGVIPPIGAAPVSTTA